jgi:PhzF family phenazine biosynthesis protein
MKLYIVDAFADKLFTGNPAGVCILNEWLSDERMQQIAMENNQAETAFVFRNNDNFHIRWFTPAVEVDLCGHATLAAAHVLFRHEGYNGKEVAFDSRSGKLTVTKGEYLTLNFPVDVFTQLAEIPTELAGSFGMTSLEVYKGKTDYMAVFNSQKEIESLTPDYNTMSKLDARGVIVTAPGDTVDFVSRFFAPQSGINEDPVTGSAHTTLTPYWAGRLDKTEFTALQLSKRGGKLFCALQGDRVTISGQAVTYLIGEILN